MSDGIICTAIILFKVIEVYDDFSTGFTTPHHRKCMASVGQDISVM